MVHCLQPKVGLRGIGKAGVEVEIEVVIAGQKGGNEM
jgi:hypothetical protein